MTAIANHNAVLASLQAITDPLPLVAHSWPYITATQLLMDSDNADILAEVERLTGSFPISLTEVTQNNINTLAAQAIAATRVCITYRDPYATLAAASNDPSDWGNNFDTDYDLMLSKTTSVKSWLATARTNESLNLPVTAVVIDCENWFLVNLTAAQKDSLRDKYNTIYNYMHAQFPSATIVWYERGAMQYAQNGWQQADHFRLDETGDCYACSLYTPLEWRLMQEVYRRTLANADRHGVTNVVPFISLGYNAVRTVLNSGNLGVSLVPNSTYGSTYAQAYPTANSHQIGYEINNGATAALNSDRYENWTRAPFVYIFPDPGTSVNTNFWSHFIAYCQGAFHLNTA